MGWRRFALGAGVRGAGLHDAGVLGGYAESSD